MSAPSTGESARAPALEAGRPAEASVLRLRLYGAALGLSTAVFALFQLGTAGLFTLLIALALAAVVLAAAAQPAGPAATLLPGAALGASLLAFALPLAGAVAGGAALPDAVAAATIWPQVLVLLFASRVLAELNEGRFARFWAAPFRTGRVPRTQSMTAAVLLGLAATLLFYQLAAGSIPPADRLDGPAIVLRALNGRTAIHVAILGLFFVLVAAILDAALIAQGDAAVLEEFRRRARAHRSIAGRLTSGDMASIAARDMAPFAHSRAVETLRLAIAERGRERQTVASATAASSTLQRFHLASRRLIRLLLSFLPLLGFLGTVIGLTAAIGSLPADLGSDPAGGSGIGASLAGLALKFETTLLGLAGGLVASLLLALLERREGEIEAECHRLVDAADADPR